MIKKIVTQYLKNFPDEKERLSKLTEQLATDINMYDRKNFRGHMTASGLILYRRKILLIKHNALNKYLQPGGHVNIAESPYEGALREVLEETGIQKISLAKWHHNNDLIPIDVDTHFIPANQNNGESAHYHHDLRYVFSYGGDMSEIKLQRAEVADYVWKEIEQIDNPSLNIAISKIKKHILS